MEYRGKLLSHEEALQLEKKHKKHDEGCFMFFFKFKNKQMWYVIKFILC